MGKQAFEHLLGFHGAPLLVGVKPAVLLSFRKDRFEDFDALLALKPELVIFGSGARLRFPHPRLVAALTAERVRLPDGTSATRYPWNGEEVLVRDDALTIIRVIEVLTDEDDDFLN